MRMDSYSKLLIFMLAMHTPQIATSQDTNIALDELIAFANPADCTPATAFQEFWDSIFKPTDPGEKQYFRAGEIAVPSKYRASFGKPSFEVHDYVFYVSKFSVSGVWQGLQIKSVRFFQDITHEKGFELEFDATREQLLQAVNRAGFMLPTNGKRLTEEDYQILIGIRTEQNSSYFTCHTG